MVAVARFRRRVRWPVGVARTGVKLELVSGQEADVRGGERFSRHTGARIRCAESIELVSRDLLGGDSQNFLFPEPPEHFHFVAQDLLAIPRAVRT